MLTSKNSPTKGRKTMVRHADKFDPTFQRRVSFKTNVIIEGVAYIGGKPGVVSIGAAQKLIAKGLAEPIGEEAKNAEESKPENTETEAATDGE